MKKVKVYITLKESVLDPQGNAVKHSLHNLDFNEVNDVRIGKYMELTVQDNENIDDRINDMCKKLLANTVIEDYRFDVEEVVSQ